MPIVRRIVTGLTYSSILLSVVSGSLSLFQYFRADEDKIFVIFTSTPALSVIAGFIAIIVLLYDSLKMRTRPTRDWAALSLAFVTYWLSGFVLTDYVRAFSGWQ